jgi:hypothetical protein
MRAWGFAVIFGVIGAGLGAVAASGAGVTSAQPLWALSGGAWLAILGAILGGTADIVQAIGESTRRHRQAGEGTGRKGPGA